MAECTLVWGEILWEWRIRQLPYLSKLGHNICVCSSIYIASDLTVV